MKKQISLKKVLVQNLLGCCAVCAAFAIVWTLGWGILRNTSLFLNESTAAGVSMYAEQVTLPEMTAETFDAQQLDPLCRYVLFDTPGSGDILKTNLNKAQLKKALRAWKGEDAQDVGYQQYYLYAKLQDGKTCLLQYDYSTQYANQTMRNVLPDAKTSYFVLGFVLMCGIMAAFTHRLWKFLSQKCNSEELGVQNH